MHLLEERFSRVQLGQPINNDEGKRNSLLTNLSRVIRGERLVVPHASVSYLLIRSGVQTPLPHLHNLRDRSHKIPFQTSGEEDVVYRVAREKKRSARIKSTNNRIGRLAHAGEETDSLFPTSLTEPLINR